MAAAPSGRRTPRNESEWALQVEQRLTALESGRTSIRILNWVFTQDPLSGEIIASNSTTGEILTVTDTLRAAAAAIAADATPSS